MEEWQFSYFEKIFKVMVRRISETERSMKIFFSLTQVDHMKIERTSIKPPSFLGIQWTGAGHEIAPGKNLQ